MTPPAVLIVNSSTTWGGNEFWSVRIARGLADRGWRVGFAWDHPVVGERVAAAGLAGIRVRLRSENDVAGLFALRREMLRLEAGAVLLTRWREYWLGGLASRLIDAARRPRVALGLGLRVVPRDDPKRRLIFRLADRVLVNAPEIREALCTRPWIAAAKVAVVINGVDLDRWRPRWEPDRQRAGREFRRSLGVPAEAPLVVNVGNLTAQKDQANLIAACALARQRLPGLRAVIVGDGALRPRLERDIRERGLDGRVILAGFLPDVAPALAAADLFVLSSDNEGMAWVLMEAAATGLPIVTTDVAGALHCVEHGETGRVVPVRDAPGLATAIAGLLADRAALDAMGRRARRLAEARLDARRMLDETAAVLLPRPDAGR
ncbi:MAG TPA: glycosyltransferase [Candidatus Krumholzibacteria bacterium]|nr:glycosyltransferase [Candidatus Krumholzibacteria bacterium]HPD72406.1 glycosyltransferase [Candidatus Krumholzibacteria bacterium]HRY40662.1 glycosyltransferase [Candidatus Krumholzibacteria bacterium]